LKSGVQLREEQIAAIARAIAELEEEDALAPGTRPGYFARFSIAEREPWIEIVLAKATVVNLWYPFQDPPASRFRKSGVTLPADSQWIDQSEPSCTFSIPRGPRDELARFVDSLFVKLYEPDADYALEIEMCAFE
jgi:hypothetical protein